MTLVGMGTCLKKKKEKVKLYEKGLSKRFEAEGELMMVDGNDYPLSPILNVLVCHTGQVIW